MTFKKFRGIEIDPRFVDVRGGKNDPILNDGGKGDASRSRIFKVIGDLLYDLRDGLWLGRLWSFDPQSLLGEFSGFDIHWGAFDSGSANIDTKENV